MTASMSEVVKARIDTKFNRTKEQSPSTIPAKPKVRPLISSELLRLRTRLMVPREFSRLASLASLVRIVQARITLCKVE